MSLAEIRNLLTGAGATRLEPGIPVWELAAPWWPFSKKARHFDAALAEILAAAFALPGRSYLVMHENPQEYEVGGPWARAAENTWSVPESCAPERLLKRLLHLGDWSIYCASGPVAPDALLDAFEVPPAEFAEFALAHGLPFFAQALDRNNPWRLWIEPVSGRRRVAA